MEIKSKRISLYFKITLNTHRRGKLNISNFLFSEIFFEIMDEFPEQIADNRNVGRVIWE